MRSGVAIGASRLLGVREVGAASPRRERGFRVGEGRGGEGALGGWRGWVVGGKRQGFPVEAVVGDFGWRSDCEGVVEVGLGRMQRGLGMGVLCFDVPKACRGICYG